MSKVAAGEMFYRHAGPGRSAPAMVHIHGFAISGSYLLPTAALLTDEFDTYVPDLPGYGRSPGPRKPLGITGLADAVVAFMDSVGLDSAALVANSMGCPVIARVMQLHPERVTRAILVSPAGGLHNRPIGRGLAQLAIDGLREPPTLMRVAGPDYLGFGLLNGLRLFSAMTQSPTIKVVRELANPMMLVAGSGDPLLPSRQRLESLARVVADQGNITLAWLNGPAHAINFSHPELLAALIREYMHDPSLTDAAALPPEVEVLAHARR